MIELSLFKNFFSARTVMNLIVIATCSNLQCLPEKVVIFRMQVIVSEPYCLIIGYHEF